MPLIAFFSSLELRNKNVSLQRDLFIVNALRLSFELLLHNEEKMHIKAPELCVEDRNEKGFALPPWCCHYPPSDFLIEIVFFFYKAIQTPLRIPGCPPTTATYSQSVCR